MERWALRNAFSRGMGAASSTTAPPRSRPLPRSKEQLPEWLPRAIEFSDDRDPVDPGSHQPGRRGHDQAAQISPNPARGLSSVRSAIGTR